MERWSVLQYHAYLAGSRKHHHSPSTRRPRLPRPDGYRSALEAAYAVHLTARVLAQDLRHFRYEPVRLRLAERTTYTPDFLVVELDGTQSVHEVKGGYKWEDAMVKLKVAAELYPWWPFYLVEGTPEHWRLTRLPAGVGACRTAPEGAVCPQRLD